MPMSASVLVDREETLEGFVDEALASMPEELRHTRWLLKERDEYLDTRAARDAEDIVEAGRSPSAWSNAPRLRGRAPAGSPSR